MKNKLKSLRIFFTCILMVVFAAAFAVGCKEKEPTIPEGEPKIVVADVPETGIVGREVTLPAATATDSAGEDISASVKLTVAGLKTDNSVGKEFIFNQAANVERKFTPVPQYLTYSIVYKVKDSYNKTAEASFTFVAEEDKIAPIVTITEEGYDATAGISGDMLNGFALPAISAIDQPGDVDVTASATYAIYSGDTAVVSNVSYEAGKVIYLAKAGEYKLVINAKDNAGNVSENLSVDVHYAEANQYGVNLINGNRVVSAQDTYLNGYGELCVGTQEGGGHKDEANALSSATLSGVKVNWNEIVAVSVNMDAKPVGIAGNWFYQMGFALGRSDGLIPQGNECVWPNFEIRFFNERSEVHGTSNAVAGGFPTFAALRDGKDHQLYLQLTKSGEIGNAESPATIALVIWVDKAPVEGVGANAFATLVIGTDDTQGQMNEDAFKAAFNAEAHYLTFGAVCMEKPAAEVEDTMTIKSVVVHEAGATEFADIIPPTVKVTGVKSVYDINENMNLPTATTTDGTVKIYLTNADGDKSEIQADYVPTVKGAYTLSFVAQDANGNYGYAEYQIKVLERDEVAPTLTLSSEATIEAKVGEAFALPTATANDDKDGVIEHIVVNVKGAAWANDIGAGKVPAEYTIMAAGEHSLEYSVSDEYGNVTKKIVKVNVTGGKTGNVISEVIGYDAEAGLVNLNGNAITYSEQQVMYEKVSMLVNFHTNADFHINIAGPRGTTDGYPQGIMMRIFFNRIEIRIGGANGYRLFKYDANPYNIEANLNRDTVLDWQISKEIVGGYETLRFRIWFDGEEIIFTDANVGGSYGWNYTSLAGENSDGGSGICLLLTCDPSDENYIYSAEYLELTHFCQASELYISSVPGGSNVDIKGLRIDGTSFADAE